MENLFAKIKLLFVVMQKGKELKNVETWKNTQAATGIVISVLAAVVAAFNWNVSESDIQLASTAVSAIGGLLVSYWAVATSKRAGLPSGDVSGSSAPEGQP